MAAAADDLLMMLPPAPAGGGGYVLTGKLLALTVGVKRNSPESRMNEELGRQPQLLISER
jgi:hypothetical protein